MKVKAVMLILDYDLYPRHYVDPYHVTTLREAIRSGAELPPVIADKETKKVVDGFHRITANIKEFGEATEVEVEWREYADDAELFADAITFNASHGRSLYKTDWVRCVAIGRELGIEIDRVATLLHVTREKLERVEQKRVTLNDDGRHTALKPGQEHWAGKSLSFRQKQATKSTFGDIRKMASVLAQNLDAGMLDLENQEFVIF